MSEEVTRVLSGGRVHDGSNGGGKWRERWQGLERLQWRQGLEWLTADHGDAKEDEFRSTVLKNCSNSGSYNARQRAQQQQQQQLRRRKANAFGRRSLQS
jgi:hypothetical protein